MHVGLTLERRNEIILGILDDVHIHTIIYIMFVFVPITG